MQLVRRHHGRGGHRFDGRLRAPMLGDEGNGAAYRVIVSQRCFVGRGLGQAMV
jgi:hypothetical protein